MSRTAKPEIARREEGDDQIIATAVKGSMLVLAVLLAIGGVIWWLATRREVEPEVRSKLVLPQARRIEDVPLPRVPFVDITRQAGIDFVHENGATGDKLLPDGSPIIRSDKLEVFTAKGRQSVRDRISWVTALLFFFVSGAVSAQIPQAERDVLIALYSSTVVSRSWSAR